VTLEIVQQDGPVVRRYSSTDAVIAIPDPPNAPWPVYWYRPPQRLATTTGMHRFLWDVHYQPLATGSGAAGLGTVPTQLPIQAIPYNSPTAATTPWVAPGTYTVKLTVNGRPYTQPIVVKQDPRVKTPAPTMQQVYTLTKSMYFGAADAQDAAMKLSAIRDQLTKLQAQGATAQAIAAFEKKAAALEGTRAGGRGGRGGGLEGGGRGRAGRGETPPQAGGQPAGAGRGATPSAGPVDTLWGLSSLLSGLMNAMQAADVAPTANTLAAVTAAQQDAARVMAQWNALHTVDLPALNASLRGAGLAAIDLK